uniref:Uncharacterized protein n=1 Tax=Oryza glumipatula TaxID=40148 RepID=A0A0E0BEI1_9ORYZ
MASRTAVAAAPETSRRGSRTVAVAPEPYRTDGIEDGDGDSSRDLPPQMASRTAVAVAPETSHHGSRTEAATAALEPSGRRWRRGRWRRLPSPPMWMTPEPSRVDGVEDGGSGSSIDLSLQMALRTVAVAPEPSGGSRG